MEIWLLLICRRRHEVTANSRICSDHFINGVKRNDNDLPQVHVFPWQKSIPAASNTQLTPLAKLHHDHCYCSPHYRPSSYSTSVTTSDMVCLQQQQQQMYPQLRLQMLLLLPIPPFTLQYLSEQNFLYTTMKPLIFIQALKIIKF